MNVDIKNLVDLNKERRQDFLTKREDTAFQDSLSKIKHALTEYNPAEENLSVSIDEFLSGTENAKLCKNLVEHLKASGIDCKYKYEAGWSDGYDSSPSYHLIVFNF